MIRHQWDYELANKLNDPTALWYPDALRQQAAREAARGYSRYRPLLHRYGSGLLVEPAVVGSTTLFVVGGPFTATAQYIFGQYPEVAETVAVSSISMEQLGVEQPITYQQITLSAPTTQFHSSGSPLEAVVPGMALVPNQCNYPLSPDTIKLDKNSLDIALGIKTTAVKTAGFYDSSYAIASALSGILYSGRSNWGLGYPSGFPIAGNPYNNPNSGLSNTTQGWQPTQYYLTKRSRPMLTILPPPTGTGLLDFYYWGSHIIDTVPEGDAEAVLEYGAAVCLRGRAAQIGAQVSYTEDGNTTERTEATSKALMDAADKLMKQFDIKIRLAPVMVGG